MSEETLKSFFANLRFKTHQGQELWNLVKELPDSFDADFSLVTHIKQSVGTELPTLGKQGIPYLPIEYFRADRIHALFRQSGNNKPAKIFKSSGTTEEAAAQSLFSTDGLLLYMGQSLKIFHDVMKRFYRKDSTNIGGISLIPHVSEWPDSSLSQMISWFSDFWKLSFVKPEELSDYLESSKSDEPLWIFGTAFHYVNLFDRGMRRKLPEGSLVFETGGYKGKSRELSRDILFKLISDLFFIPTGRVVSEYGMCELACQAYDFTDKPDRPRTFRLPAWVNRLVYQGSDGSKPKGEGALVVYDPLRIDFPWPIRTQDVVDMKSDSTFSYMGRVPHAPLKGCSFKAEEDAGKKSGLLVSLPSSSVKSIPFKLRPKDVKAVLIKFLNAAETLKSLEREFHSSSAATQAIEDLKSSLPSDEEAWQTTIQNSNAKPGDHWLIIAPNNHSLASIYPVVVGAIAGLKLSVRLPRNFEHKDSFLHLFLTELSKISPLAVLPSSLRIPEGPLPENLSHIMIFGDDKTILNLEKKSSVPLKAFGTGITVSLLSSFTQSEAKLLAKDALSLGQKGCLSSRALFSSGSGKDLIDFLALVKDECHQFWNAPLSIIERIAIDQESIRYRNLGTSFAVPRNAPDDCYIPVIEIIESKQVTQLLSSHPFVLPVFYYRDPHKLVDDLKRFPQLICLSAAEELLEDAQWKELLKGLPTTILGSANSLRWNGFHNGVPLF